MTNPRIAKIIAEGAALSLKQQGPVALVLTPEEAEAFRGPKEGRFISVIAVASVNGVPAYLGRDVLVEDDNADIDGLEMLAMGAAINALTKRLQEAALAHADPVGSA